MRRCFTLAFGMLAVSGVVLDLQAGGIPRAVVLDDFNDEVFNDDEGWLDFVVVQGSVDTSNVTFDEEVNAGVLTVNFVGRGGQTLGLLREDDNSLLDQIREYVEVTVAFLEGSPTGSNCARVGIHMQARVFPEQLPGSRADTFRYGLEANGRMRVHAFRSLPQQGILPDEYADPALDIKAQGYVPGDEQPVTLRITRISEDEYAFDYGFDGTADQPFTVLRVPEGGEPLYAGLLLDNGTCDYVATFESYTVGTLERGGGTQFVRGDTDASGRLEITDAINNLNFQFAGASVTCRLALDTDDNGVIDLTDAVYALNFQFLGGSAIPPPNVCGRDPTADALDCDSFRVCP
jgi:hypothetical protein